MHDRNLALDGARALACLAVIGHHAQIPGLQGGWLGVDVFFVLSGWLITGLLLRDLQRTGRIGLGRFYLRRAARLYPALIACVGLAMTVDPRTTVDRAAVAVSYLSDVYSWRGHDVDALSHTWSLAIEEHFYVLWPLVLVVMRTHRRVRNAALAGCLLSLGTLLAYAPPWLTLDSSSYSAPQARMWELMLGCALATVDLPQIGRRARTALSSSSLLLLVTNAVPYAKTSLQIVIACGATVGLLVGLQGSSPVASLLAARPLARLGQISYGVYLYHFPIIVAAVGLPLALPARRFVLAAAVAVTILVSELSYRWLEEPLRRAVADRARPVRPAPTVRPVRNDHEFDLTRVTTRAVVD